MSSLIERKFMEELSHLLQQNIKLTITSGKTYTGQLTGIDPKTLNLCLTDAKNEEGKTIFKMLISGRSVLQIEGVEKPFDLAGLAKRLERVFPRMVKLHQDIGVIVVMDKVRVSEKGVIEGEGPAAERVIKVYDEFTR
jgi:small nuclear ribonucleoprotein (snRNP)-like protein